MSRQTLSEAESARFLDWMQQLRARHRINLKELERRAGGKVAESTMRRWKDAPPRTVQYDGVVAISEALGLGRQLVDHAEGTHVVPVPDTNPLNDDEDRMDTLERAIDQIRADLEELKRLLGTPPGDP